MTQILSKPACAAPLAATSQRAEVCTRDIKVTGKLLRIAAPANQYDPVADLDSLILELKANPPADLFTFSQKLPDTKPHYQFYCEFDNLAAIPITTFDHWWNEQVEKKVRKHVRRAAKAGVEIRKVPFDDTLVRGIMHIYNEVPVRGGRPFRHYGDDFETCKRKHVTFVERSDFIGAFLGEELIGFVKMVYAGSTARTIQNIAMVKYGTLAVGNALLAKAVELAAEKKLTHLIYGKMEYDNKGSKGFEDYKRANGFEMFLVPKYYVPLSTKGRLALRLRLHRGWDALLPKQIFAGLRAVRSWYYSKRYPAPPELSIQEG